MTGRRGHEPSARFFAELYVGLYYEAIGDRRARTQHSKAAARDSYATRAATCIAWRNCTRCYRH